MSGGGLGMMAYLLYALILFLIVLWVERPGSYPFNSLIIRRDSGKELEDWLKKFHWGNRSELKPDMQLPSYKFYSEVIETLLRLARKLGGNYQDSLMFLREGLQSDRQFEKKLKDMIMGCWMQMGLMMTLTWLFIFGALTMVDIKVAPLKLLLIFLWQCVGLAFLPMLMKHFRKKLFADIGEIWRMLYVLNSLARIPLSRTEVMTMAGVQKLKTIKQKNVLHIVDKLKEICQRALQIGGSYEEEVRSLMAELRFQEKWHFELFEKRLIVIKLGLMSLFFLPSYLAFIFLLLGDLMSLM